MQNVLANLVWSGGSFLQNVSANLVFFVVRRLMFAECLSWSSTAKQDLNQSFNGPLGCKLGALMGYPGDYVRANLGVRLAPETSRFRCCCVVFLLFLIRGLCCPCCLLPKLLTPLANRKTAPKSDMFCCPVWLRACSFDGLPWANVGANSGAK